MKKGPGGGEERREGAEDGSTGVRNVNGSYTTLALTMTVLVCFLKRIEDADTGPYDLNVCREDGRDDCVIATLLLHAL